MSGFYGTKIDYFYGDGLNLTADEVMGGDSLLRTGDKISVEEYDLDMGGEFEDIYQITEIQTDENGKTLGIVMFVESTGQKIND